MPDALTPEQELRRGLNALRLEVGWGIAEHLTHLVDAALAHERAARVAAEGEVARLTARLNVGLCVYCGHESPHESAEARREAMIEHTITCVERPEPKLLDALAAVIEERDRLAALVGVERDGETLVFRRNLNPGKVVVVTRSWAEALEALAALDAQEGT